jgi:hypothetical protein
VLYTYHFFFFFWGSNNRTFASASTVVQLQAKSLKKCWNSNFFSFMLGTYMVSIEQRFSVRTLSPSFTSYFN